MHSSWRVSHVRTRVSGLWHGRTHHHTTWGHGAARRESICAWRRQEMGWILSMSWVVSGRRHHHARRRRAIVTHGRHHHVRGHHGRHAGHLRASHHVRRHHLPRCETNVVGCGERPHPPRGADWNHTHVRRRSGRTRWSDRRCWLRLDPLLMLHILMKLLLMRSWHLLKNLLSHRTSRYRSLGRLRWLGGPNRDRCLLDNLVSSSINWCSLRHKVGLDLGSHSLCRSS
jgi:hypothetical protein